VEAAERAHNECLLKGGEIAALKQAFEREQGSRDSHKANIALLQQNHTLAEALREIGWKALAVVQKANEIVLETDPAGLSTQSLTRNISEQPGEEGSRAKAALEQLEGRLLDIGSMVRALRAAHRDKLDQDMGAGSKIRFEGPLATRPILYEASSTRSSPARQSSPPRAQFSTGALPKDLAYARAVREKKASPGCRSCQAGPVAIPWTLQPPQSEVRVCCRARIVSTEAAALGTGRDHAGSEGGRRERGATCEGASNC